MNNWIDATKQLPEEFVYVIVFDRDAYSFGYQCGKKWIIQYEDTANWISKNNNIFGDSTVSYWMPLPEPPK